MLPATHAELYHNSDVESEKITINMEGWSSIEEETPYRTNISVISEKRMDRKLWYEKYQKENLVSAARKGLSQLQSRA